ncbi:MAG: ATP-binding protein [Anaerolineae bacterium]
MRRLINQSRPRRFPRLHKIGRFFLDRLRLVALFSFIFRGIKTVFRSLWFRMVGVYAVMLLILLAIVLNLLDTIAFREIAQFNLAREQLISEIIVEPPAPDLLDETLLPDSPPIPSLSADDAISDLDNRPPIIISTGEDTIEIDLSGLTSIIDDENFRVEHYLGGSYFFDSIRDDMRTAFIIASGVVLLFGTAVFWQISRPLTHIRTASHAISQGDHSVRVPVKSHDELGRVATAFNQMAEELEKQDEVRKKMVADVAHELRTPLTVMKSNLEAMLDGLLEPTENELGELHDEVGRLSRMIEDLRMLSLADAGELPIIKQQVDIRSLLGLIVTRYRSLAETNDIELVQDETDVPLLIYADSDKLQQAIRNLLENALHYTPEGGRVRVTAVRDKKMAHISIIDTGSGIPSEELAQLFDRFWRGDRSRNRHSGGSGLGLAIVQQIVDLHEGKVTAVSPDGTGAVFTISLPLEARAPRVTVGQSSPITEERPRRFRIFRRKKKLVEQK